MEGLVYTPESEVIEMTCPYHGETCLIESHPGFYNGSQYIYQDLLDAYIKATCTTENFHTCPHYQKAVQQTLSQ